MKSSSHNIDWATRTVLSLIKNNNNNFSPIMFAWCVLLFIIVIFHSPVFSSSSCSSPWSTWTSCLYHGYRTRFRDCEVSNTFSCSGYPEVEHQECRHMISSLGESCCILAGTSASWPDDHVMTLYVVVNALNSDGDTARIVLGVENTVSLPDLAENIYLLVIPNRSGDDGDVIQLLPPDRLISHAVDEPQLCLTDSVSKGETDVMVLQPIPGDKYKVLHSKEKGCLAEWSTWSQCIDGVRSKSRDCYTREFNCSFFPEIVTEPCQQLGLLYPPDNTLFLIPGEFSTVKLRPIIVGLPVSFEYSSPDANSPVLSSDGTFQWTFPIGAEDDLDYSFTFSLNNTAGHYRLMDLIVKSSYCGCTGMHDHCVLPPWGTVGFGPFERQCQEGWAGELCDEDINECSNDPKPCFPGVLCINVIGSFWCDGCPEGTLGDGVTCS